MRAGAIASLVRKTPVNENARSTGQQCNENFVVVGLGRLQGGSVGPKHLYQTRKQLNKTKTRKPNWIFNQNILTVL